MSASATRNPRRLLYVEDNPGDVFLVRTALKECKLDIDLAIVEDGVLALDYLRKQGRYQKVTTPHLVLLDLNLPKKSGEEVLVALKADPVLKMLPVIVFSSGVDPDLCVPVYRKQANSCVRKPNDLDDFTSAIQLICSYWFALASLPE